MLNSRDLKYLHWKVREKYNQLEQLADKQGIKFVCVSTARDEEYQRYIYEQGRSRKGNIVTNVKVPTFHNVKHCLAFDIVPLINGKIDWNAKREYEILAKLGKSIGLTCGYYWKSFPDSPHFQLDDGLSGSELLSGKRPSWFYDKPTQPVKKQSSYEILAEKKIITIAKGSFDWKSNCESNADINGVNVKALINNTYKYCTKKWSFTFTEALNYLVTHKMISDVLYWEEACKPNGKASGTNVGYLIANIAKFVEEHTNCN